jgi:hypothetical protein
MSSVNTYSDPASDQSYSVIISVAKMPSKCWGRYVHVGVVATVADYTPHSLDERPKGVIGLPFYAPRCCVGKTECCASKRADSQAHRVASAKLKERIALCNRMRSSGYLESLAERVDEI